MLNGIWIAMILAAVMFGGLTGRLDAVGKSAVTSAGAAVTLAIGLVGVMAFFLGLMRVLHEAGLLAIIARALRPIMVRLFPGVPADSPAMSMMIMNMTSNMLGLGNAATPFGLKAMMELDELNEHKGTATDAMALFLAINTSALALLPSGIISLRASLDSDNAASIILPTWVATAASTIVAVLVAKVLCRLPVFAVRPADHAQQPAGPREQFDTRGAEQMVARQLPPMSDVRIGVVMGLGASLVLCLAMGLSVVLKSSRGALGRTLIDTASNWILVILIAGIVLYGLARGVKVYDAVVEGGKEGFTVALKIIPYLVAILVAVGMLRAAGVVDMLVNLLDPVTNLVGMPAEALPMALLRPLSGSGAYGVAAEIMQSHGPDSLVGQVVSTMQGSTETTFYVLALYFGVVNIRRGRHTLAACLTADVTGALMAAWACRALL